MNTAFWDNKKKELLERIHLNGVHNYKYIPEIVYLVFTNFGTKIETVNINLSQKKKQINIRKKNRKDNKQQINFVSTKA